MLDLKDRIIQEKEKQFQEDIKKLHKQAVTFTILGVLATVLVMM